MTTKHASTKPSFMLLLGFIGTCLVLLLSSCGIQPGSSAAAISMANTTTIAQTVPMPPTQTSCPADGTARAAVMRTLSLGTHQNMVYIYNEIPPNTSIAFGHLKRYDVVTGQKTVIATSGLSISNAQVSADGQWILFLSQIDPRGDAKHSAALQLVRMDGQGLQTLYCFPAKLSVTSMQWSTDQKSVLFATDTATQPAAPGTSTITLLDIASGKLHTELQIHDPLYSYTLVTWLDNTRAYVLRAGRPGPPPPQVLYLLDTQHNPTTNGSSLKKILEHAVRFSFLSFDSSYDAKQLFVSYCLTAASPFDTTIWSEPATGGTQHTLYHQAPTICAQQLRAISSRTLFIVGQRAVNLNQPSYNTQVWTLNTDGSNRKVLFDIATTASYSTSPYSQFPWSTVSRDGKSYMLQTTDNNTGLQTIVLGSLNGSNPQSIAYTYRGSVSSVGWTTM